MYMYMYKLNIPSRQKSSYKFLSICSLRVPFSFNNFPFYKTSNYNNIILLGGGYSRHAESYTPSHHD